MYRDQTVLNEDHHAAESDEVAQSSIDAVALCDIITPLERRPEAAWVELHAEDEVESDHVKDRGDVNLCEYDNQTEKHRQ